MTKQRLVDRVRRRLSEMPGARKSHVRLYVCEVELYRRLLDRVSSRALTKAVRGVLADLDRDGDVVEWLQ